jgi:signal transduction histidine kinase
VRRGGVPLLDAEPQLPNVHDTSLINASITLIAIAYAYAVAAAVRLCVRTRARSLLWFIGAMAGLAGAYVLFAANEFSLEHVNRGVTWTCAFLGVTIGSWFLLRFACALAGVGTRRVRIVGDVLAIASIALQLVVPGRVAIGYVDPTTPQAIVHASISAATIYAVLAGATVLWRASRRMPGIVRSRYRLLAIAVLVLYVVQLASGIRAFPDVLVVALVQLVAILMLVVAAVPPRWLRDAWQAPLLRGVLRELADVAALTDGLTIRTQVLPRIAQVASARRVVMRDLYTGELLGAFGEPDGDDDGEPSRRLRVPASSIELEVFGTPHDPFFGREDEDLVQTLGVHLAVALGRSRIIELERDAAAAVASANAALQQANHDLRDLAELRDSFVAIASHELRTPITTITGFTSTLLDRWDSLDDEERRRYLEFVDRDASRLGGLVEDLLLLSSVESPDFRIAREQVDVGELLELVAHDTGLEDRLELRIADGPLRVVADARHLRQVLSNLVANSRRHGAEPIAVHAQAAPGTRVRIEVRDAGPGVPEQLRERIFERFARGETAHGTPGSGLGLFIVRRLVELQGGRVWYDDGIGGGACFVVELEAAAAVS